MPDQYENGLNRTLGKIEAMLESAQQSREIARREMATVVKNIDTIKTQHSETMGAVRELTKDHEYLKARVDSHAVMIDGHEKLRQRGLGLLAGAGVAGGGIGALISKYLPFWPK